ncbi:thiol:disulfide interchange protein DsbD [Humitalea rosea]|uniref:Thiol:disulfide interchange protein DsbD n=1 Tax=Humitalea rosea TaxID=990373 RepID=A0A2W7I8A1_9PROT|nr:protein-disulfide reductase DsbD domain-containing protein [Humitalea rosea]PZW43161.1 thiol:disulfide interchange protein DsbD [Humitalea rosea]
MRAILLLLAALVATPALGQQSRPATAGESAAVISPRAEVTLLAEPAAIAPGQPFRIGLRQRLAPGWHTYWRNPGDAGQATDISLTLPAGADEGGITWPTPQRIPYGPLVNYGYEGEVLLPITVTPPADLRPGDTFTISAEASWLVCADVCIPEEGLFTLSLPVEPFARLGPHGDAFLAAEAATPRPSPWPVRAGFLGTRGTLTLVDPALTAAAVTDAYFFAAENAVLDHVAPQPRRFADGAMTLDLARGGAALPATLAGVVVITDAAGVRSAYEVAAPPGAIEAAPAGMALWQAAGLALLGGLLLNLMPCVFPVLAMKAMALVRLGGAAQAAVRIEAGFTTLGVLASFSVLAGVLLVLRAAGGVAGWGFQFQSPLFVAGMAWVMLGIGLNLSGVFHVGGPVGVGAGLAARGHKFGSFMTGVLAVLVATPCTAPFMAAALGAAFVLPPLGMLAVFLALGLGLAAPYAALAVAPGLARALPRPGAWMGRLQQALAFPMYGAAIWLVWVVAQQSGPDGMLLVLVGGLLLAFGAWALGVAQASAGAGRRIGRVVALLAVVGAAGLLLPLRGAAPATAAVLGDAEPWSAEKVAALRAAGRPVFVNLTAAWCITCKVNDRLALETTATRALFAAHDVAYLKGDWTRGDPAITALLRAHERAGVPTYLFYPPGGGEPRLLPQVLTEAILRRAVGG